MGAGVSIISLIIEVDAATETTVYNDTLTTIPCPLPFRILWNYMWDLMYYVSCIYTKLIQSRIRVVYKIYRMNKIYFSYKVNVSINTFISTEDW